MDANMVIKHLEKFLLWGSVALLVFFSVSVFKFHKVRGPFAKEAYYRLGLYDRPLLYLDPEPYVPSPDTGEQTGKSEESDEISDSTAGDE